MDSLHLIQQTRDASIRTLFRSRRDLRVPLKEALDQWVDLLARFDNSKNMIISQGLLRSEALAHVDDALESIMLSIKEVLFSVLFDELHVHAHSLQIKGYHLARSADLQQMAFRWSNSALEHVYPESGSSAADRLRAIALQMRSVMVSEATSNDDFHPKLTVRDLQSRIIGDSGSLLNSILRVVRIEASRVLREALVELYRYSGVRFAKWVLGDSHGQHTGDVCEALASYDGGEGKGIFPIDSFPPLPHPHCFCLLDAVDGENPLTPAPEIE